MGNESSSSGGGGTPGDRSAENGCGHSSWSQPSGGYSNSSSSDSSSGSIHNMNAAQRCAVGADVAARLYDQSIGFSSGTNIMDRSGVPSATDQAIERGTVAAVGCAHGVFNPGGVEAAQGLLKKE